MIHSSPNAEKQAEKRRYQRCVFTQAEQVKGSLVLLNGTQLKKEAVIMDLSRNGIGLAISKRENGNIHSGDLLRLARIYAVDEETWINLDITLKIIWVLNHGFLDNIGFGCEFQAPPDVTIHHLVDFINSVFPGRMR